MAEDGEGIETISYQEGDGPLAEAAAPYTWPMAHDVRPARQALGAKGCTDCHSPDSAVQYGKVIYRALEEGRWVVTVSGDGSLGLSRVDPADRIDLSKPPEVRDYQQVEAEARRAMESVGFTDVLRRLWG